MIRNLTRNSLAILIVSFLAFGVSLACFHFFKDSYLEWYLFKLNSKINVRSAKSSNVIIVVIDKASVLKLKNKYPDKKDIFLVIDRLFQCNPKLVLVDLGYEYAEYFKKNEYFSSKNTSLKNIKKSCN